MRMEGGSFSGQIHQNGGGVDKGDVLHRSAEIDTGTDKTPNGITMTSLCLYSKTDSHRKQITNDITGWDTLPSS